MSHEYSFDREAREQSRAGTPQMVECVYHHWAVPAADGSCPVCGVFSPAERIRTGSPTPASDLLALIARGVPAAAAAEIRAAYQGRGGIVQAAAAETAHAIAWDL